MIKNYKKGHLIYSRKFIRYGSISNTDGRSARDAIYSNKRKYFQGPKHALDIKDENTFDFIKVRKNGTEQRVSTFIYNVL